MIYCGSVPDFPSRHSFELFGDGRVKASLRLGILQTWWASAIWQMNDKGYLEEQISDMYYPYQGDTNEYNTNFLVQNLKLF